MGGRSDPAQGSIRLGLRMLRDHGDRPCSGMAERDESRKAHVLSSHHDGASSHRPVIEIDPLLELARREDARWTCARDEACSSGTFPASGREQHGARLEVSQSVRRA